MRRMQQPDTETARPAGGAGLGQATGLVVSVAHRDLMRVRCLC